jgi:hypothetical protein
MYNVIEAAEGGGSEGQKCIYILGLDRQMEQCLFHLHTPSWTLRYSVRLAKNRK